ncbi:hypothetical protein HDU86_004588 [Geranomyces michiganensis]|nr:hypothetical protein HDU86_004588 [Geranomyces michiganensis]
MTAGPQPLGGAPATGLDAVFNARIAAVPVFAARPFSAAAVDLIEDVLGDRAYESALRTLESFISGTVYPPSSLLDKVLSIPFNRKKDVVPFDVQIHAMSVLNLVFTRHGSAPFRPVLMENEASDTPLWELIQHACGWDETVKLDRAHEATEEEEVVRLELAGPIIRLLLDVVGHDLALNYRAGNVKKSILATSLGRYRKADFRAPLDVMSEMTETSVLGDDAIPLVAALIYELALLAMAGNSDLTSFLRDLLPNLKALKPDELQEVLSCIPSDFLRLTLADMLLRNLCTLSKNAPAVSSDATVDPVVALALLTVTPSNTNDWNTVTLLITQLVGSMDVTTEEQHELLRDAAKRFHARAPKRSISVAAARALEDVVELVAP